MKQIQKQIGVVPFGEIPEILLRAMAANITDCFHLRTAIIPPLDNPSYAFDEGRFQYDAGTILQAMHSMPFDRCEKIIGILEGDLFIPVLTYVFGEAKQSGRCALISTCRLSKNDDNTTPPMSLLFERTTKVALHELGHLFNLVHCPDQRCLMHFAGGLEMLDQIPLYFCRYCSIFLRDNRD